MKITRGHELEPVDRALLKQIYDKVKHAPKDGQWRTMKGVMKIKDHRILVECDFVLHGTFITVDNLNLQFPQKSLIIH